MENHGYIEQVLDAKDFILGAASPMPKVVVRADGQWDPLLPDLEVQRFQWGDSMDCVTRSFLNVTETLQKSRGENVNYSDRALAKASGTTRAGNSMRDVANTARTFGLVDELLYPSAGTKNWDEYYGELPSSVKLAASVFAKSHQIQFETVFNYADLMCEALTYSPLQIAIYAYGELKEGIYQNPAGKTSNHCVELYGYVYGKYWKIYDHYDNKFKKLAWDHNMTMLYRIDIQKTMSEKNPLKIPDNTMVQESEKSGTFGLHVDGKVLIAQSVTEDARLAMTIMMRGALDKPRRPMTVAEWAQYPKLNLKWEPIN